MIIRRIKHRGIKYVDESGAEVTDPAALAYIKSLVIPPAYDRVEIRYNTNDKVTYVGYDAKERPQHHYAEWWIKQQRAAKFCDLIQFGKTLPRITADIRAAVQQKRTTKNKIIALIMRVIMLCSFRIGHEKYSKLYQSYGISTIEKRHVAISQGALSIAFVGKKGVANDCVVVDPIAVREIKALIADKAPNEKVFTYTKDGERKLIKPTEVNDWLKAYDPKFTSKMFRVFMTNLLLINSMKKTNPRHMTEAQRKKHVVQTLKEVSCVVHNTPAVCKKDYSDTDVIDLYVQHPSKWHAAFAGVSARVGFLNFLKKKC
jgi:DNA topoisomerase-1